MSASILLVGLMALGSVSTFADTIRCEDIQNELAILKKSHSDLRDVLKYQYDNKIGWAHPQYGTYVLAPKMFAEVDKLDALEEAEVAILKLCH